MSAIEGKLILDALNEIEEPARLVDIIDYIKDKNDCPISMKAIESTVQSALDAGVRYGFIQQDADYYYSEAQIIKKLDQLDKEEGCLEDEEVHIFKTAAGEQFQSLFGSNGDPEAQASPSDEFCCCGVATDDVGLMNVGESMQVDPFQGPRTASIQRRQGGASRNAATCSSLGARAEEELGPPLEKRSRLSHVSRQSKRSRRSQQSQEDSMDEYDPNDQSMQEDLEDTDCDNAVCVDCGRCSSMAKKRKRRARGKSRKRGCSCRR